MPSDALLTISRPELQSHAQRTLLWILGLTCWSMWIWLWLPLMTSALWLFGVREIYQEIFKVGHGVNFDVSLWLIIGPVSIVIAWSCYNRGRYSGLNRRAATKPLSTFAKASSFGVTNPEFIGKLEQRRMELDFLPDGQLARVDGFAHPISVHIHASAISLEMFGTRSAPAGNCLPIMENQAF